MKEKDQLKKLIEEMRGVPRICEYWQFVTPYGVNLLHKEDCKHCAKRKLMER